MTYDPTRPADIDLIKKSAELIRANFEGLRKDGIVIAKPPFYAAGEPKVSLGENGDRYVDTVTGNHYYKNLSGQWEQNLALNDKYESIKEVAVLKAELSEAKENFRQLAQAFNNYCPYIVGEYKLMSHNELDSGWVRSDGGLYDPKKYPKAFAIYGTQHGGDGVNTFAVPDWRGDAIRINDDSRGVDLGRVLGSEQEDAMQNIVGEAGYMGGGGFNKDSGGANMSGAFTRGSWQGRTISGENAGGYNLKIDASRVVRTADETRMRNRSCCMYVYIGRLEVDA